MLRELQTACEEPAALLGDAHPLLERIGSADGLAPLGAVSATLRVQPVDSLSSLRKFLRHYQTRILLPVELPAIQNAFNHASHNQTRELVELDRQLAREPVLRDFAEASRRVGQRHLRRLHPLRDQRLVQRYLGAVERGDARGWHTLVYGVILAIFSLPLRQGLHSYARRTLRGFIHAAARPVRLTEKQARALLEELCAGLPAAVETLLARKS